MKPIFDRGGAFGAWKGSTAGGLALSTWNWFLGIAPQTPMARADDLVPGDHTKGARFVVMLPAAEK